MQYFKRDICLTAENCQAITMDKLTSVNTASEARLGSSSIVNILIMLTPFLLTDNISRVILLSQPK